MPGVPVPQVEVLASQSPSVPVKTARPVVSGVTVVEIPERYTVSGNTRQEVQASLDRVATISDRVRWAGFVRTSISWRYGFERSLAGCRTSTVAVTIEVRESIPHWIPLSSAAPGLKERWQVFSRMLSIHEDGHRQIGIKAANEIRRRLEALPPAATCDQAVATANALGLSLIKAADIRQVEYDRATGHGHTQGADPL